MLVVAIVFAVMSALAWLLRRLRARGEVAVASLLGE